jgi:hypothetical protein
MLLIPLDSTIFETGIVNSCHASCGGAGSPFPPILLPLG